MAIANAEQEAFKAMRAIMVLDTASGGLFAATGTLTNYLSGGVYLADDPAAHAHGAYPRVLFSISGPDRYDGEANEVANLSVRVIVEVDRNNAFGAGDNHFDAGVMAGICNRLKTVFDTVSLTVGNFGTCKMHISRGPYPAPSTKDIVRRIIEIPLTLVAA